MNESISQSIKPGCDLYRSNLYTSPKRSKELSFRTWPLDGSLNTLATSAGSAQMKVMMITMIWDSLGPESQDWLSLPSLGLQFTSPRKLSFKPCRDQNWTVAHLPLSKSQRFLKWETLLYPNRMGLGSGGWGQKHSRVIPREPGSLPLLQRAEMWAEGT